MANICDVDIVVHGSFKEVWDFFLHVDKAFKDSFSRRCYCSFAFYQGFGFSAEEIDNNSLPYVSGDMLNIHEPCFNGKDWHMMFSMQNKWSPNISGFNMILSRFYKTLHGVYFAVEPGNGIFINTDVDRRFFTTSYCLDDPNIGCAYFNDLDSVIKVLDEDYHFHNPNLLGAADDITLVVNSTLNLYFHRFVNI